MVSTYMKKYSISQPGFVILFTILIAAIILMIGLGIFSVATRETTLSGTSREAQAAFYAADAGVECALYAQSLPQGGPLAVGGNGGTLDCGALVSPDNVVQGTGSASTPFEFDILVDTQIKACAHVTVYDTTSPSGKPARRVISQGFNICDNKGKPLRKNPLLVERDLDTIYEFVSVPDAGTPPAIPLGADAVGGSGVAPSKTPDAGGAGPIGSFDPGSMPASITP